MVLYYYRYKFHTVWNAFITVEMNEHAVSDTVPLHTTCCWLLVDRYTQHRLNVIMVHLCHQQSIDQEKLLALEMRGNRVVQAVSRIGSTHRLLQLQWLRSVHCTSRLQTSCPCWNDIYRHILIYLIIIGRYSTVYKWVKFYYMLMFSVGCFILSFFISLFIYIRSHNMSLLKFRGQVEHYICIYITEGSIQESSSIAAKKTGDHLSVGKGCWEVCCISHLQLSKFTGQSCM
jgi:hypothetical protein